MNYDSAPVLSWLSLLDPSANPDHSAASKPLLRANGRAPKRQLPSPQFSTANATPTKKRRHGKGKDADRGVGGDGDGNDETTPRAPSLSIPPLLSSEAASSTTSSDISGTSSPTKQLSAMRLHQDSFQVSAFSVLETPQPESLAALVMDMRHIANNIGVISPALEHDIQSSGEFDDLLLSIAMASSTSLPSLPLQDVRRIIKRAERCDLRHEEEASWNSAVHTHLLLAACQPTGEPGLVDFMSCTTARICHQYRPRDTPSKMVDFCMFIDPSSDDADPVTSAAAARRINNIRSTHPDLTINHTSYLPLADLPLAVSIETKKSSTSSEKAALLQIGTWQSAQLRMLAPYPGLTYLPGIMIVGHLWHFIITMKDAEGGQPTALSSILFGSTDTVLGVYRILAGISRLRTWMEVDFWPVFKREVLGMA